MKRQPGGKRFHSLHKKLKLVAIFFLFVFFFYYPQLLLLNRAHELFDSETDEFFPQRREKTTILPRKSCTQLAAAAAVANFK